MTGPREYRLATGLRACRGSLRCVGTGQMSLSAR